ncbi:hypothetical protein IFM89_022321 [Coptis chinensis]|uniref:Uncharacterized protein n=1 Tax=Coptis chinensis TaxID=261450 RepID=A0A835I2E3_9MAGN|nr:hypothetical protein IFM89_022321 [Coptis chinensis]
MESKDLLQGPGATIGGMCATRCSGSLPVSELLLHANVDTFIVFRSAVLIFVAMEEALYLHQPWPSIRTCLSLSTIFAGSVLYVLTDYQFTLTAYSWALTFIRQDDWVPHEPIL